MIIMSHQNSRLGSFFTFETELVTALSAQKLIRWSKQLHRKHYEGRPLGCSAKQLLLNFILVLTGPHLTLKTTKS